MKEKTVGFLLRRIITDQFATIESALVEKETVELRANISFGINEQYKVVGCFSRFEFLIQNSSFIIIHVTCEFEIEEKAWVSFIDIENNKIIFPKGFMSHLAVITVGTTRGVLHAKTENTKFNNYFLPTINVNDFIKDDISLDLEKKQ